MFAVGENPGPKREVVADATTQTASSLSKMKVC